MAQWIRSEIDDQRRSRADDTAVDFGHQLPLGKDSQMRLNMPPIPNAVVFGQDRIGRPIEFDQRRYVGMNGLANRDLAHNSDALGRMVRQGEIER